MAWVDDHQKSEALASEAHVCKRIGDSTKADRLYHLAAESELSALSCIPPDKNRTLGIIAVSAASLFFKAHDFGLAERVACQHLAEESLPDFARSQLQEIAQSVWNEQIYETSGVNFASGQVLVSVGGGLVAVGAAPLDLVHRKMDEVKNLFYRTVEMFLNLPARHRGVPSRSVREQFRPWLIQAPPGSYQFAIRVEKPKQMSLFPDASPEVEHVTRKLLEVIDAASHEDPQAIEQAVPDPDYRDCFLKQTRNLAPTGKTFDRLEIRSAGDMESPPIVFLPNSRKAISANLRKIGRRPDAEEEAGHKQLVGILRGLHLDKDWLEIVSRETGESFHILGASEVIDDVVGPMVNHPVIVDVVFRHNKPMFRDIQSEE